MKDEKIEVKEIVLNIEGKEISLSPEKARLLKNALDKLFPQQTTISYPIYVDRWRPSPWYPYPWSVVYCKGINDQQTTAKVTYNAG